MAQTRTRAKHPMRSTRSTRSHPDQKPAETPEKVPARKTRGRPRTSKTTKEIIETEPEQDGNASDTNMEAFEDAVERHSDEEKEEEPVSNNPIKENEGKNIISSLNLNSNSNSNSFGNLLNINNETLNGLLVSLTETTPDLLLSKYRETMEDKLKKAEDLINCLSSKILSLEEDKNNLSMKNKRLQQNLKTQSQIPNQNQNQLQSNNSVELNEENIKLRNKIANLEIKLEKTINEIKIENELELQKNQVYDLKDEFFLILCGLKINDTSVTDAHIIYDCSHYDSDNGKFFKS